MHAQMAQSKPYINLSKNVAAVESEIESIKRMPVFPLEIYASASKLEFYESASQQDKDLLAEAMLRTLGQWSEILAHSYYLSFVVPENVEDIEKEKLWEPLATRLKKAHTEILLLANRLEGLFPPSFHTWIVLFLQEDSLFMQVKTRREVVDINLLQEAHARLRALTYVCHLYFYNYECTADMKTKIQLRSLDPF